MRCLLQSAVNIKFNQSSGDDAPQDCGAISQWCRARSGDPSRAGVQDLPV